MFKGEEAMNTKTIECDGIQAFFFNWEKRVIAGWSHELKDGDILRCKMETGKIGLFKIKNLKRCLDPKDQYFADVTDIGYE